MKKSLSSAEKKRRTKLREAKLRKENAKKRRLGKSQKASTKTKSSHKNSSRKRRVTKAYPSRTRKTSSNPKRNNRHPKSHHRKTKKSVAKLRTAREKRLFKEVQQLEQKLTQEIETNKQRQIELEQKLAQETETKQLLQIALGVPIEKVFPPEEIDRIKRNVAEQTFRQYTKEEQSEVIRARWREITGLASGPGRSRKSQIDGWIDRNGFNPAVFWAEYRRRQK